MQTTESSQDLIIQAINILLAARRMTRKDLAEALGKDQFWIGHRMNNRTMFKFTDVESIARAFGLSVPDFLAVPDAIPSAKSREEVTA